MLFQDDTGHQIQLNEYPSKIISLCPSITETLFDLGLENEIAGLTSFCIHPYDKVSRVIKVGGPKKVDLQLIHSLAPDLIIASKEENSKDDVMYLRKSFSVCTFDVKSVSDAIKMIKSIGILTGKSKEASGNVSKIQIQLAKATKIHTDAKALYLIWKDPWMAAGNDTFISDMMQSNGIINSVSASRAAYPVIHNGNNINTDYILLSSEPFPFSKKHFEEVKKRFGRKKILLVDGEMFSWYGTRIIKAFPYIKEIAEKIKAGQE